MLRKQAIVIACGTIILSLSIPISSYAAVGGLRGFFALPQNIETTASKVTQNAETTASKVSTGHFICVQDTKASVKVGNYTLTLSGLLPVTTRSSGLTWSLDGKRAYVQATDGYQTLWACTVNMLGTETASGNVMFAHWNAQEPIQVTIAGKAIKDGKLQIVITDTQGKEHVVEAEAKDGKISFETEYFGSFAIEKEQENKNLSESAQTAATEKQSDETETNQENTKLSNDSKEQDATAPMQEQAAKIQKDTEESKKE